MVLDPLREVPLRPQKLHVDGRRLRPRRRPAVRPARRRQLLPERACALLHGGRRAQASLLALSDLPVRARPRPLVLKRRAARDGLGQAGAGAGGAAGARAVGEHRRSRAPRGPRAVGAAPLCPELRRPLLALVDRLGREERRGRRRGEPQAVSRRSTVYFTETNRGGLGVSRGVLAGKSSTEIHQQESAFILCPPETIRAEYSPGIISGSIIPHRVESSHLLREGVPAPVVARRKGKTADPLHEPRLALRAPLFSELRFLEQLSGGFLRERGVALAKGLQEAEVFGTREACIWG